MFVVRGLQNVYNREAEEFRQLIDVNGLMKMIANYKGGVGLLVRMIFITHMRIKELDARTFCIQRETKMILEMFDHMLTMDKRLTASNDAIIFVLHNAAKREKEEENQYLV